MNSRTLFLAERSGRRSCRQPAFIRQDWSLSVSRTPQPSSGCCHRLIGLGATEVVPEVFESGLALAEEVLSQLDLATEQTRAKVYALRNQRYGKRTGPQGDHST